MATSKSSIDFQKGKGYWHDPINVINWFSKRKGILTWPHQCHQLTFKKESDIDMNPSKSSIDFHKGKRYWHDPLKVINITFIKEGDIDMTPSKSSIDFQNGEGYWHDPIKVINRLLKRKRYWHDPIKVINRFSKRKGYWHDPINLINGLSKRKYVCKRHCRNWHMFPELEPTKKASTVS